MRIAVVNWNNRRFGGTGSYLSSIIPILQSAGHEVALWHEVDRPDTHPVLPKTTEAWSVSALGVDRAVAGLRSWRPDVLYAHGLLDPSVERRALDVAPAVFFAHDYYGTCISGHKTFSKPVVTPCDRRFGWGCLAHYYPRRCGGLSPITLVKEFGRQSERLDLLSRYAAIVTHSSHMQQEYLKHGIEPHKVFNVKYGPGAGESPEAQAGVQKHISQAWRLLFVGRMDRLKGGAELIDALPDVARRLARPVDLIFAGDGPDRAAWQARASSTRESAVSVEFRGWVARAQLDELYARADLLVLPSLWPEPLALVGLEAGRLRLPTVAFDVGGIADWLHHGVNGILAPGNPPTVRGLADAVVAALRDPHTLASLREGAAQASAVFTLDDHFHRLMNVLQTVTGATRCES